VICAKLDYITQLDPPNLRLIYIFLKYTKCKLKKSCLHNVLILNVSVLPVLSHMIEKLICLYLLIWLRFKHLYKSHSFVVVKHISSESINNIFQLFLLLCEEGVYTTRLCGESQQVNWFFIFLF
jgi:hypothetical protein